MLRKTLALSLAFVVFANSSLSAFAADVRTVTPDASTTRSINSNLQTTVVTTPQQQPTPTRTIDSSIPVVDPDITRTPATLAPESIRGSSITTPTPQRVPDASTINTTTTTTIPASTSVQTTTLTPTIPQIPNSTSTQNTLQNTPPATNLPPTPQNLVAANIVKSNEDKKTEGINVKIQADNTTGAFIMNYPIKVPPGRNGLEPNLSLNYNSQSHDLSNIFGYGWSVNIPYIERINKSGTNNLYSQIFFSSSLDGELEDISLVDGFHGNYGAKVETGDYLNYEYLSNNSWKVTDKSGTIYKFGINQQSRQDNPNNSLQVYKWMLEEVRDTNDNFIIYEYLKDEGQIYPAKIKYTGNGNTEGISEIGFTTTSKSDANTSYKTGFKVKTNYLVFTINTSVNNAMAGYYLIDYQYENSDKRPTLNQITYKGSGNGNNLSLPPYKFEYKVDFPGWAAYIENKNKIPVDLWNKHNEFSGTRILDLNGDGLPDIYFCRAGSGQGIYINQGENKGWQIDPKYNIPLCLVDSGGDDLFVRMADVNGDGLEDLIKSSHYMSKGEVYLNKGDGTGWALNQEYIVPTYFDNEYYEDIGVRIVDFNGDGLPDLVRSSSTFSGIYINKGDGTGWTDSIPYYIPEEFTDTGTSLADINGDGLVDILYSRENHSKSTYINNGNGWYNDTQYTIPVYFADKDGSDNGVRIEDANGDGLPDIFYAREDDWDNRKVYINSGDGTGWKANLSYKIPKAFLVDFSTTDHGVRLADVDGDGCIDFLYRHDSWGDSANNSIYSNFGQIPYLMRKFYNDKGGKTQIDYKTSTSFQDSYGKLANPKFPLVLPLVRFLWIGDGSYNSIGLQYEYQGGEQYYKSPLNRKFAGFSKIIQTNINNGDVTKTYFHQGNTTDVASGEFQDSSSKIAKPYAIEKYDNNNKLYSKTFEKWESTDIGNGRDFVKLTQKLVASYDGTNSSRSAAEKYTYDSANGNIIKEDMLGEVQASAQGEITSDVGNDEFTIDTTYAQDSTKILNLPATETIKDQNGNIIKQSKFFYDGLGLLSLTKGNMTKQSFWTSGNKFSDTTKTYNNYGLVTEETDPLGNKTTYQYDSQFLYPSIITNSLGQKESYTYDYSSGKVEQFTDKNGNKFETTYDYLDREISKNQPDSLDSNKSVVSTTYTYNDTSNPVSIVETNKLNNSSTGYSTYTYIDGLNRVIQKREQTEDSNVFSVKDFQYNKQGLLEKESLPYFSNSGGQTNFSNNDSLYIKYTYDPLDRIKTISNSVGATTYSYDKWKTTIQDAENNKKDLFKDAYDNLVKVLEYNEGKSYQTEYKYNGLNKLTKLTDALGNIRNFSYDGLGRQITAEDLHASADKSFGSHTFAYDSAGNLTSEVDQNAQTTNYAYDKLNRLLSEDFTGQSGVETNYVYDSCSKGVGQLCSATTGTVTTNYGYTNLGDVASESRIIDGKQYLTSFNYDWQGNPTSISYPGNAGSAAYTYNNAGRVKSIQFANKDIVKKITYAPTGAIETIENANGTIGKNNFDASKLYRLSSKFTSLNSKQIQNIAYLYDKVGNILSQNDNSSIATSKTVDYKYDNLYRLKSAASLNAGNKQNYYQTFQYDALGNILSKTGQGDYGYSGNQGNSYAIPHAVTSIGSTNLSYDNNGNLLSDGKNTYKWDYKNRLIESVNANLNVKYVYDHTGERIKKSDGVNFTIYPNKFYEVRNDATIENIYAGDENVATIEIGKVTTQADPTLAETTPTPSTPNPTLNDIVYEDAEDGKTLGWTSWNPVSIISNNFEDQKHGKAITLKNSLSSGGFKLVKDDGTPWNNTTHKFLSFDLNSADDIQLSLNVETNKGTMYLQYNTIIANSFIDGNYFYIKLDKKLLDSQWHTVIRDLQADINSVSSSTTLNKVNYFQIWWMGQVDHMKLDNIKLMGSLVSNPVPVVTPPPQPIGPDNELIYENGEDGKTLGWVPTFKGSTLSNIYENVQQGKIILLNNASFYNLNKKDGTPWNDSTHKFLSWDMNYKNDFFLKTSLSTTQGNLFLTYYVSGTTYVNQPSLKKYYIKLGDNLKDAAWHNVTRDLQADLKSVLPSATLSSIKLVSFQGIGKVDNIKTLKVFNPPPVLPPAPDPLPQPDPLVVQPPFQPQVVDINKTIYHHTDHLSGTNIDTDETGAVVEMTDYFPFGEIRADQTTTAYRNPYKFTGKELDGDIGMYYYGARYYNPAIGRFASQDPWEGDLENPQTLNKYSYVMNNPLKYVDPTGKFALAVFWDALGGKLPSNTVCVGCGSTQNDSKSVNYGKIGSLPEPTSGEKTMYMILGGLATGGLAPEIKGVGTIIQKLIESGSESKNNKQPIVIGETMNRVREVAEKKGWDYYKSRPANPKNYMKNNRSWIQRIMNQGREILDAGRDPKKIKNGDPIGKYYKMELNATKDYPVKKINIE